MPRRALVKASDDRRIPTVYEGQLEPNYYCRGWNAKREKYCRARAGKGTTHRGVGRCKMHGGIQADDGRVKHGRYLTTPAPAIRELIAKHMADPDPLNIMADLAAARSALDVLLDRMPEGTSMDVALKFAGGVSSTVDVISKAITRLEQLKTAGAVSLDQVRRFLGAVDRTLQLHVADEKLRDKIRRDIYAIRV